MPVSDVNTFLLKVPAQRPSFSGVPIVHARVQVQSLHARAIGDGLMSTAPNLLGPWMADVMRRKGISRQVVAEAVGVDPTSVSRWITKSIQPQYEKIRPLADVLGEDYGEVLARAGYGAKPLEVVVEPFEHQSDPLVLELERAIGVGSPLDNVQIDRIRLLVDAAIDPYRRFLRTRRKVG